MTTVDVFRVGQHVTQFTDDPPAPVYVIVEIKGEPGSLTYVLRETDERLPSAPAEHEAPEWNVCPLRPPPPEPRMSPWPAARRRGKGRHRRGDDDAT